MQHQHLNTHQRTTVNSEIHIHDRLDTEEGGAIFRASDFICLTNCAIEIERTGSTVADTVDAVEEETPDCWEADVVEDEGCDEWL